MSQSQDVVGVFDEDLNQLFVNARSVRALINPRSKIMEHPVESGATISDHVVVQPTEIELSLILKAMDFQDTYVEIKTAYEAKKTVTVQTKTDTYASQLIYEIPHDETPEMFDTVAVAIKLREVILVDAQYAQMPASKVKKKSNASKVKTGQKQPVAATPSQSSAAYDLIFGAGK